MTINLSTICKTANHLTSTGMARSQAFKAAWMMAKRGGVTKAVGVTYENRQKLLAWLAGYSPEQIQLHLERNQGNQHDPNAVAVVATVEAKGSALVGFIAASTAARLARLMDHGIQIKAVMERLVGGVDGLYYGMRLRVAI